MFGSRKRATWRQDLDNNLKLRNGTEGRQEQHVGIRLLCCGEEEGLRNKHLRCLTAEVANFRQLRAPLFLHWGKRESTMTMQQHYQFFLGRDFVFHLYLYLYSQHSPGSHLEELTWLPW